MEDPNSSTSSVLPAGRRICFLVGAGGEIVAVQLLLLLVGVANATFLFVGVMFDMVEVESFVEKVDCPAFEGIELKEGIL
jgi:hypothetical protein